MNIQRVNWQIWMGFLLSLAAFVSYASVFARWAVTRDFPWANLLLFGMAAALLGVGVRRAWTKQEPDREGSLTSAVGRPRRAKVASSVLTGLSVLLLALFIFTTFISSRWLPASQGAPQVGHKAPDFSLADTNGNRVSLSQLLSSPLDGKAPRGLLLVFYRGYW